jgi:DedD protein
VASDILSGRWLDSRGFVPTVELPVKERLTGAIILVVLIVLLVPELLSGPKRPATAAPAAPTSSEQPPLRSYTINLGDDSHSQGSSAGSNGPAMPQPSTPEQPLAQSSPASSEPSAAQSQTPAADSSAQTTITDEPVKPRPTPSPTPSVVSHAKAAKPIQQKAQTATAGPSPASSGTESGWGVQLGVFASRDNAERLALDVRVKGFKASVSPVTSGSRKLYRVRVGPTPDRAAAQELQGRLRATGRPGGTVVPYS